jgi:Spy/CpxP family protein refolding chaperone
MYRARILFHLGQLAVAAVITTGTAGIVSAGQAGMTGSHDLHAIYGDGCRLAEHDSSQAPEDFMQTFADELGLSGQQQQDLKILMADYGERLRDLAKLMRESSEKLLRTEPGDPNYWPLAQEVSALAATSTAETVILLSELREKIHAVLTADQRAELKRRIAERKAQCKPQAEMEQPAE